MVFGFGEGKIDLLLDKVNFRPGDTIKGKLVLDLKKMKKARELRIVFQGTEIARGYRTDSRGRRVSDDQRNVIHSFPLKLDGEKEYSGRTEYDFEINVPTNLFREQPKPEGFAGAIVGVVQAFSNTSRRIEWHLMASLDIPGGIDVAKNMQINVG